MSWRRRSLPILVVAALVLGVACADDDDPAGDGAPATTAASGATSPAVPTSMPPADGAAELSATVERSRLLAPNRMLEVIFRNSTPEPVRMSGYRLESPLFEPIGSHQRDLSVRTGGGRVSAPLPYGQPRCEAADAAGSAIVALVDGEELRLPIDPAALAQQHREECASERVRAAVDLRFGDAWVPGEQGTVVGRMVLRQRERGASAYVDEIAGTVVFSLVFEGDVSDALRVDDRTPVAEQSVVVSVAGCSAHALIESKKSYKFPTWVSLDGDPPVRIELEPTGDAHEAMEGLLPFCGP